MVRNLPTSAEASGDVGLIPGSGGCLGGGNGKPFWYSCLGNPMDRGVMVHGVGKSWIQLSN